MINYIHLVWHIQSPFCREDLQRNFLKYTAQQILKDLPKKHPAVLPHFLVNAKDRKNQIWERNPLSIELWSREVIGYMHLNPDRAGVCKYAEEYLLVLHCFTKQA
jgi:hypothetical protein